MVDWAFATARSGGVTSIMAVIGLHGANVRDRNRNTLLHAAASLDNVRVVEALAAEGAELDAVNNFRQTALHVATFNHHLDTVELLLSLGADSSVRDYNGKLPVDLAFEDKGRPLSQHARLQRLYLAFEGWTPQRHRACNLQTQRGVLWLLASQKQRASLTSRISRYTMLHILTFTSQAHFSALGWLLV